MSHDEIVEKLVADGFTTGWVLQGTTLKLWLNAEPIPAYITEVELTEPDDE